jgi:DDE superfamily endonuclease
MGQRATYSRHSRHYCVKFYAVSEPDGFILHMYGPIEGRRHDMTLYRESLIDEIMQTSMNILGVQHCLYGDPAYCLRPYLQVGFQGSNLTEDHIQFNSSMSKVLIAVEWTFRDIKMYFTHIDLPRKLKVGAPTLKNVTPAGLWYVCSAVLWNFRVCMYESQTAEYFDCDSISIEEHLE